MGESMSAMADRDVSLKMFEFRASAKHKIEVPGDELASYASLPVESYVLFDSNLMTRLTDDVFELQLPFTSPLAASSGVEDVRPWLRVRVVPGCRTTQISSIGASLFGWREEAEEAEQGLDNKTVGDPQDEEIWQEASAPATLPAVPPVSSSANDSPDSRANSTERVLSNLERGLRSARLNFSATLDWANVTRGGGATQSICTRLKCTVRVTLGVALPPPFGTLVPKLIVQGAANVIIQSVIKLVLPQFMSLLEQDFYRWRNGTRNQSEDVGLLMQAQPLVGASDDQAET